MTTDTQRRWPAPRGSPRPYVSRDPRKGLRLGFQKLRSTELRARYGRVMPEAPASGAGAVLGSATALTAVAFSYGVHVASPTASHVVPAQAVTPCTAWRAPSEPCRFAKASKLSLVARRRGSRRLQPETWTHQSARSARSRAAFCDAAPSKSLSEVGEVGRDCHARKDELREAQP